MAFAFVIAAVPLIGMVALGGEAGSWYVTKQHAQNAADAAAYSGALRLACTVAAQTACDTETVDQRGKQFAAQNAFCNAGRYHHPRLSGHIDNRCLAVGLDYHAYYVEFDPLETTLRRRWPKPSLHIWQVCWGSAQSVPARWRSPKSRGW